MKHSHVYIVAPGDFTTGGPELSHQLCGTLNRSGVDSGILYHPFRQSFEIPQAYRNYDAKMTRWRDVPADSTIILPEIYTGILPLFRKHKVLIWWQSVDNYHRSSNFKFLLRNHMKPWSFHNLERKAFPPQVKGHLVQSEYARLFLAKNGIKGAQRLSDYLNPDYIARLATEPASGGRDDIVAYNPKKGAEKSAAIIKALPPGSAVPIVNMTRDQVIDLLGRAKVYMDFGNHPGKDRIPREAAALGCCIITNRSGSAANDIDVPVDPRYKIDDADPGFADAAAKMILEIFADFETHQAGFADYRRKIAEEPAQFAADVRAIFVDQSSGGARVH